MDIHDSLFTVASTAKGDYTMNKISDILIKTGIIVFAMILIYQIILKLTGHSWQLETIIIALVLFLLQAVYSIKTQIEKIKIDNRYIRRDLNEFKIFVLSELKDIKGRL